MLLLSKTTDSADLLPFTLQTLVTTNVSEGLIGTWQSSSGKGAIVLETYGASVVVVVVVVVLVVVVVVGFNPVFNVNFEYDCGKYFLSTSLRKSEV